MNNESQTHSILTIDDEEVIRTSIKNYLEDFEYTIYTADNGSTGIQTIQQHHPDLILVDLRMPGLDGLEVLQWVKKHSKETPIIVVSGTGVIQDVIEALHLGAWDYLLKPIEDLSVLRHAIEKALERAHLIKENRRYQNHLEDLVAQKTKKLIESERQLDSIINTVPDIIYRLDPEGRISFISDSINKYGYSPKELLGKDIYSLIHRDDHERAKCGINERRTGQRRTRQLELRLLTKDQKEVCFEASSLALTEPVLQIEAEGLYASDEPKPDDFLGTQGIARDISKRKEAEKAKQAALSELQRSEQKYRYIAERSYDLIATADLNGTLSYISPSSTLILGYRPEEMQNTPFSKYVLPADSRVFAEAVQDLSRGIPSENLQIRFKRKKKSVGFLELNSQSIYENGQIVGFQTIARDITARKQAEMALQTERDRAQLYLDIAGVMFLVIDHKETITMVNRKTCEVLQYDESELLGKNWFNLAIPESQKADLRQIFYNLLDGNLKENEYQESPVKTKTGNERMIAWHNAYLKDESGEIIGTLSSGEDITERKQAEEELNLYRENLEAQVEKRTQELQEKQTQLIHSGRLASLGEMATGIAHELNQPLSIIRGQTELMQIFADRNKIRKKDLDKSYDIIIAQVDRAAEIINHMRGFSRKNVVYKDAIDVNDPVSSSMVFFKEQFRVNNILLNLDLADNLPKVNLNPQKFEQIIVNFVNNARYAVEKSAETVNSPDYHKKVTIRTFLDDNGRNVVFEVKDNGIGMSPETADRCLEPFFTTKDVGEGTGLGLSIVNGLVGEISGTIQIESTLDVGTAIRVLLPCKTHNTTDPDN